MEFHAEANPATNAVRAFIERSPQSMPALQNANAAFAAHTPLLQLLKPTLFLPLFACGALGVMAWNGHPPDSHLLGLGFFSGGNESGIRKTFRTILAKGPQPAWPPDERRIAFSSGRDRNLEIYTIPAPR